MTGAVALVLLLQTGTPSATTAGRPPECGSAGGGNLWQRAKLPELRRYCDLLAGATAKFVSPGPDANPKGEAAKMNEAVALADQADKLLPGRAAPSVLKGRALLRLGKAQEALAAFKEARHRDERSLDDPVALLAWARANARAGQLAEAARAYRAALPRTSALSAQERAAASFEAGMSVMAQGPNAVDEAIPMLRQARRDAQDAMQIASVVALALALDRAGLRDEAKAVLAERVRSDARSLLSDARVLESLANAGMPGEAEALVATALEVTDAAAAREAWRRYADGAGAKGAWGEHARSKRGGR